jgi:hypothetical protein
VREKARLVASNEEEDAVEEVRLCEHAPARRFVLANLLRVEELVVALELAPHGRRIHFEQARRGRLVAPALEQRRADH